jgi:hypothetical protein
MKTKKITRSAVVAMLLLISMFGFYLPRANAFQDSKKKQLQTCLVQDGDNITQIGNTCKSGGEGCITNPCGE